MTYQFIVYIPGDSGVQEYTSSGDSRKRTASPTLEGSNYKKSKTLASADSASKDAADGGPARVSSADERTSARSACPAPAIATLGIRGGFAIRGTELSSNAEVVPMLVGSEVFHVCLPYISRELYEDNQIRANYDRMVREIKAVVGGQAPVLDTGFVSYDVGEPDLPRKVSEALGRNCVVRVRNYQGETRLSWDDTMYNSIRRPNAVVSVESQSRRLRSKPRTTTRDSTILKNMAFRTFVEASSDVAKCYNLSDCSTRRHVPPWFLKHTAESTAFGATVGQNLFGRAGSSMGLPAFHEYHELAHSGYYRPSRHDDYGQCTYTWLHSGVKLWSWHRLPAHIWRRADALNGFSALDSPDRVLEGSWYTLRLEPGDVLILPPNIVHRVYTAERSIAQYGHFFCWHALHLTEMARQVASRPGIPETQKDIVINQQLSKMALFLNLGYGPANPNRGHPPIYNGVSERCLLALFRMAAPRRREYGRSGSPDESDAALAKSDTESANYLRMPMSQIPLRPEGEDDGSGWSDGVPDEDPGWDLLFEPAGLPAWRQGEFSDALVANIVARLHLRLLGAAGRKTLDSYDQLGLAWDDPGPPRPSLPRLPIVQMLDITHAHLLRAMPPVPEGWDEEDVPDPNSANAMYTLDGVREHQYVDEIVKDIEMQMSAP